MWKIQLFKLNFDHLESIAVNEVLDSGWLTMGERVEKFESKFGAFLGNEIECTAVANGTAALHMALLSLDIGVGDEVIIPSLTFAADINVVDIVGAKAVLADCTSIDDWNVSAESIDRCITSKTKAVIVVHYAGYPCNMPAISRLCQDRGIALIEDVAHAPGASICGRKCGTWGDIGCFSFFSNKNLSIGEGGMLSTNDRNLSIRLGHLRSHGMTSLTLDRHKGRAITYDVVEPGLNYRMDEIRAAIGLVQLGKLVSGNASREALTNRYRSNLSNTSVLIPFSIQSVDAVPAYHILPVLLPKQSRRIAVIEFLKAKGIQSSIHYPPFWGFTAYKGQFLEIDTPTSSEICHRQLTLPLYPTMSIDEVDLVTSALIESLS